MLQYNSTTDPRFTVLRRFAPLAKNVVVEMLRTFMVLFPPPTDSTHVMCGWSNHRHVWRIIRMKKFLLNIFWHSLYFQTQYSKLLHYLRHTMRNHSKIFATYQHIGGAF